MSQSCFSLGFLSQNSLQKLSTFRRYKGIYSSVYEECEKLVFIKQGILATQPCDWNESRANCLARLKVLSCSAPAIVNPQLSCVLHTCAILATYQSRTSCKIQSRDSFELQAVAKKKLYQYYRKRKSHPQITLAGQCCSAIGRDKKG